MTEKQVITYEVVAKIGVVTLSNAKKLNMIGLPFFAALKKIQQQIEDNHELRAVVILAEGPHFTAGVDLAYLATASSEVMKAVLVSYQKLYSFWETLPIPVIAGVQGMCIGSGVELILGCDFRIVAEDVRLSLPEVKIGLAPDMGGTTRLTKLVGAGQAKRLILSCDEVGAEEALQIGLVERVVPVSELKQTTLNYAQKISLYPPSSVRFAKKGIQLAQESSISAGLIYEEAQSIYCCGTVELQEAIATFLGKKSSV